MLMLQYKNLYQADSDSKLQKRILQRKIKWTLSIIEANYLGHGLLSDYSILICKGDRRFYVSQIKKGYY